MVPASTSKKGNVLKLIFNFLFLLGLCFNFCGCGPSSERLSIDDNSVDENYFGVIRGQKVDAQIASELGIVAIEFYQAKSFGEKILLGFCTGTLIDQNIVLTAAHCFDKKFFPGKVTAQVVFESRLHPFDPKSKLSRSAQVIKTLSHPLYNTELFKRTNLPAYDHDIALLVFEGSAPSNYQFANIDTDKKTNYSNLSEKVYGYGRAQDYSGRKNEDVFHSTGTLHQGLVKIRPDFLHFTDRYYVKPSASRQTFCQGDSGGPHFLNTPQGLKQIGVSSSTFGHKLKNGLKSCSGEGQVTKVSPFYKWIQVEKENLIKHLMIEERK